MDDVCTATTDEDCTTKCEQRPAASNSLVLYNPTYLQPFSLTSRTFNFANRDFTIRQNWADFGVAAVVWDSAVVLCEFLESQCKTGDLILHGKRVIELGAGTGLVGMVATALNGEVTVTDRDDALDPLKENVKLNFPPSPAEKTTFSSSSPSSSLSSSPSGPAVRALTWGKNLEEFPVTYDLILGADIVYLEDTFPDLLRTFLHLCREESLILLSCRIRYERDERFLQMVRKNFHLAEVLQDEARGIVIYSAQKLSVLRVSLNGDWGELCQRVEGELCHGYTQYSNGSALKWLNPPFKWLNECHFLVKETGLQLDEVRNIGKAVPAALAARAGASGAQRHAACPCQPSRSHLCSAILLEADRHSDITVPSASMVVCNLPSCRCARRYFAAMDVFSRVPIGGVSQSAVGRIVWP
ncbi:protein N-lysine methyltransferase METTL21A-like [Diadema antillarum]|uniref:protein N-lysine methyltransferase METTL21A-like n=1 Tax=Diadema antillarum TaxID=105358 RepID=UPI003A852CB2